MASGLSVGLAMGLGGIAAVALGALADAIDLETALYVRRRRPGARVRPLPVPAAPVALGAPQADVRHAADRLTLPD